MKFEKLSMLHNADIINYIREKAGEDRHIKMTEIQILEQLENLLGRELSRSMIASRLKALEVTTLRQHKPSKDIDELKARLSLLEDQFETIQLRVLAAGSAYPRPPE